MGKAAGFWQDNGESFLRRIEMGENINQNIQNRRDFCRSPLTIGAAALGMGMTVGNNTMDGGGGKAIDEQDPRNIKLARRLSANISDQDLLFLKQIGLRWARVNFSENEDYEFMRATQKRFAGFGISIYSGVHYAYRDLKVQLGQPGRDELIERYSLFLRNLGRLGIPVSCYDFHPANTYTTGHVERRGYKAREFKLQDFRDKVEKQRFDREYSAEEIWKYFTYFTQAVLPVAESSDVRLALHPDDPPLAKMNGVAKLFTHYDGYHRAEEIAEGSPNWGLAFCVGTWAEGGDRMGKDVFEMIHDFGRRGKIFAVHFRNVSSPLPHFVETFLDDGYLDMYQVMKALREVRFDGSVVPDHIPQLVGDSGIRPAGTAYCISYMRALLKRANEEVG
jgi:mannonate dehydratase